MAVILFVYTFFQVQAIDFKIVEKNTLSPISSALFFHNNKAIAISDSSGYIKIDKLSLNNITDSIFIFSISYKIMKLDIKTLSEKEMNIIELTKFKTQTNTSISNTSLTSFVLTSINNNIKKHKAKQTYTAHYSQVERHILGNKTKRNDQFFKSFNVILQVKSKTVKNTKI